MALSNRLKRTLQGAVLGLAGAGQGFAAGPDFQRDIQPLLSEHCGHCHGVDPETRQADLRLDIRQNALEGGESGTAAIVAGKPDASELVRRIVSEDPDEIMPPPHEKKPLAPQQINRTGRSLLRRSHRCRLKAGSTRSMPSCDPDS